MPPSRGPLRALRHKAGGSPDILSDARALRHGWTGIPILDCQSITILNNTSIPPCVHKLIMRVHWKTGPVESNPAKATKPRGRGRVFALAKESGEWKALNENLAPPRRYPYATSSRAR